jgi:hypothetical protein
MDAVLIIIWLVWFTVASVFILALGAAARGPYVAASSASNGRTFSRSREFNLLKRRAMPAA